MKWAKSEVNVQIGIFSPEVRFEQAQGTPSVLIDLTWSGHCALWFDRRPRLCLRRRSTTSKGCNYFLFTWSRTISWSISLYYWDWTLDTQESISRLRCIRSISRVQRVFVEFMQIRNLIAYSSARLHTKAFGPNGNVTHVWLINWTCFIFPY